MLTHELQRCTASQKYVKGSAPALRVVSRGCAGPTPRIPSRDVRSRDRMQQAVCCAVQSAADPIIRVPSSIHEVDNGKILGFGADLSEDHPGYLDEEYKARRVMIANIAREHEIGQPIPLIKYTPEEVGVWETALERLEELFPTHACREFLASYPAFNFRKDQVPQLQDISELLQKRTGWTVRPVAGLMHPRDFLAGLAFRYFHSTQYMRHASKPMYTPEPDVVHELIGHVPMLADPAYCEMVQAIGEASLGADEKTIWHLTKVYWYTVEFGVVREGQEMKAFGAGVLSSFGELAHMKEGSCEFAPFDPFSPQPKMSYKDGYQKKYFVLESFEEAARLLKDYAAHLKAGGATTTTTTTSSSSSSADVSGHVSSR